jgi:heme oxygenase
MNSAKKKQLAKEYRKQVLAETVGWLILAAGAFIGANILTKCIQVFFSLQGIH